MFLPYLKIVAVFVIMLVAMRKLGLGLSVLLGSFIMALAFEITPLKWFHYSMGIFQDSTILTIWIVIIFVLSLSSLMESTGQAERFMAPLAEKITSPRIRMVFFPMLIGMLPMPGGAVFSAPMINAVSKELPMPEQGKSLINYWFRHTVEMSWPLYPAMIFSAGLSGITTPELVMWTFPMSLVFFSLGWFFFVRPYPVPSMPILESSDKNAWRKIIWEGAPLILAIGGALVIEALIALFLPQIPLDYGIIVALALGVSFCLYQNKLGPKAFINTVMKPGVRSMIFMIGALGVFKNVLAEGGVVQQLVGQDTGLITLWITVTFVTMAVGALTGILIAAAGAVFPLIIVLVETLGLGSPIPWIMLGLASGLAGAMMSPLHICFVLSCQYFKVSLPKSLRKVILPGILYMCGGIGYFFILSAILN